VKGKGSNALATTVTKRAAKANVEETARAEEVALPDEVVERLKSWCYV